MMHTMTHQQSLIWLTQVQIPACGVVSGVWGRPQTFMAWHELSVADNLIEGSSERFGKKTSRALESREQTN